jgi:putative addiction module component
MSPSIEELENQVLKLDLEARAALAEKLLRSLDDLTEAENEKLWLAEAKLRHQQLVRGEVQAKDGEAVMQHAAAELS